MHMISWIFKNSDDVHLNMSIVFFVSSVFLV